MMKTHVRKSVLYLAVLSATLLIGGARRAAAEPLVVVVPNGLENVEGNDSTTHPMPPQILDGYRDQHLLSASQFAALPGPMWLTRMAWRPDEQIRTPLTVTFTNFELRFSTTTRGPSEMSTTFADNIEGQETLVFQGELSFSTDGSGPPGGPREFDYVMDFQTPFLYDPAQGNLLYNLRFTNLSQSTAVDRHEPGPGLFRWITSVDPDSPVGMFHPTAQHGIYVHQFTFVPEPSSFLLAAIAAIALLGAGCWRHGRRES